MDLRIWTERQRKHCHFDHVTPSWFPRLVLTWQDAPRYQNGRWWPARKVNGCIRHTRAAHRWLTFMGTPSKVSPEREAQAHIALTEVLAAAAECRYCGESITELSPGVWAWTADYGDPDERTWCDDSPDWKHARDELLAAHAAHDLPVIGCVACEAIDPGTWRERYSDYAAAHDLTAEHIGHVTPVHGCTLCALVAGDPAASRSSARSASPARLSTPRRAQRGTTTTTATTCWVRSLSRKRPAGYDRGGALARLWG